ncbi:GGDEF domain-containing protein [Thiorhodococcus mannitoliphagus]|uniref:GGDEF domain-containing protein n=1 Tax=Thiorhodococcus mannitoliphagus TaxID=329406 RepID=A0A6P1DW59_9GAMM|nr:GGDEF domain-containing protein [Thiorhodococcus mannitoliphagus]NEX19924.1 GGDEF domain-containing protein [Thiorhodococcus mannitoliphagus]
MTQSICRSQITQWPESARWRCLLQILFWSALIFAGYWLANLLAAVFEVNHYISAIYFPPAVTVAVSMMLGAGYWPVMYLAIASMAVVIYGLPFAGLGYLEVLRELVVYGLTGLALRPAWMAKDRRPTLNNTSRFIGIAFLASLVSTLLVPYTLPEPLLEDGERLLAFLGGDFAGIMIGVPLILLLRRLVLLLFGRVTLEADWRLVAVGSLHGLVSCALAVFVAWLPTALGVETRMLALLMVVPIILTGLSSGILIGLMAAILSSLVYLAADHQWSSQPITAIEIQMIFTISAAAALLSGAAQSDRLHEWEKGNFDALTGLPNRRMLSDRMEREWLRAQRNGGRMGILYIDLDRFKQVNDTLGHDAGDQLLVEAAERIRQCVRASDTVARIGGDEFLVLLSDLADAASADHVATKIRRAVAIPFALGQARAPAQVSASIGIAIYPDHGADPELLKLYADAAMYQKKIGEREQADGVDAAPESSPNAMGAVSLRGEGRS